MTEKILKSRIVHKHDIAENWAKATGFCPKQGELIIYDDRYTDAEGNEVIVADRVRFKIGDGVTNVVDLPFLGGGDSKAIIDVVELPTENINEDVFYRLLTGTFVFNQFTQDSWICHCVETLPEVGEPVTPDMVNVIAYYNVQDGDVYGYIDDNLSSATGVPAGWYTLAMLAPSFDVQWGGVITDILNDPKDDIIRLLLEYIVWSHRAGKWTSQKTIGWAGTGMGAEIFNHPSNVASGDVSHAEGSDSHAEGYSSHAEGSNTVARGDVSHAEGSGTTAESHASHSEGYDTLSSGYASHAEGGSSRAEGSCSHAEGSHSHAEGNYSHAEGYASRAVGSAQHVQGEFNIIDPEYNVDTPYVRTKYAHIVGNGSSEDNRSNAHTLDWEGTAWFAGEVKVGGTGQDDSNAKKLATEEYVDGKANDLQPKTDDTLTTTDKTIAGAINELNSKLPNTDDDDLLGTWVFNDVITIETVGDDFDFTTKDPSFASAEDGITYWSTIFCNENGLYYGDWERSDMVYSPTGGEYGENIYWDCYDEYHKIITITSEPTNEAFITWFRANATKKDDSPYQTKEDENLTTDSKTIVGAINELNSKFGDTSVLVQAVIDALPKYNGEVEDV